MKYNYKNVLDYLEHSVDRFPEKTAVIENDDFCTYRTLKENAEKVGTALSRVTRTLNPVPVLMEKGINCLSAFFGAVYAGCFYVLLNPSLPASRLKKIVEVLQADLIITDKEHLQFGKENFNDKKILNIEELLKSETDTQALKKIRADMIDTDPLYINFTSGSTGVPKGVIINHRSVIDFINVFTKTFGFEQADIFANQAPFDFDVSVKDIYSAIFMGATLVLVPKKLFSEPMKLLDYLCEKGVTVMIWAVSAMCLITTFHALDYKTPKSVKKILFSGEVMPKKHLLQWREKLPEAMFVNLYGPTEITCNCTYHIIDADDNADKIPIGKPFANERVFLLDNNDKAIYSPDETGEICVAGTTLSPGYFNAPEQTAAAFTQNPLNPYYPETIYRTGDLGYYDENGEIVFAGRKDFQIKHMGHRIELEEIERAVHEIEGIERCCCIFDERKSKLYAFYIGTHEKRELFGILKEKLPEFMVPGALRKKDSLPLSKNGKIDRKALAQEVIKR